MNVYMYTHTDNQCQVGFYLFIPHDIKSYIACSLRWTEFLHQKFNRQGSILDLKISKGLLLSLHCTSTTAVWPVNIRWASICFASWVDRDPAG